MEGGWIMSIEIDEKEFSRKVLMHVSLEFRRILLASLTKIKPNVDEAIRIAIYSCPEVQSILNGGDLLGELGLTNPQQKIDAIINQFLSNVEIDIATPKMVKDKIECGFALKYIPHDYTDVLLLPESVQYTENKNGEEYILEWLDWMLNYGDAIIIQEWKVIHGNFQGNGYSRTGIALMRRSNNGTWKVPEEFSGTKFDNFVTRAVNSINTQLEQIFIEGLDG